MILAPATLRPHITTMPGSDPIPPQNAIRLAQDTSYSYAPTAGAWSKDSVLYCIDPSGAVVLTTDAGALRVYNTTEHPTQTLLARADGSTTTTFTSGGGTYQLQKGDGEAVAVGV